MQPPPVEQTKNAIAPKRKQHSACRRPGASVIPVSQTGSACATRCQTDVGIKGAEEEIELIHHVVTGHGLPPIVFVHGVACAHSDWDAQVAHLSPRHQTVGVDLRGHAAGAGTAGECSIDRFGADVPEVMVALNLPPAVVVGHSMGCRIAIEVALQAHVQSVRVVLIDGTQFAPTMTAILKAAFGAQGGYVNLMRRWFGDMFTAKSDPAVVASVVTRAERLPRATGEMILLDMVQYDVHRLATAMAILRIPVMAMQTTYSNERRERWSMSAGQSTPYLQMLRACIPTVCIEVIPDTGHFPQIEERGWTSALLDSFCATLAVH